MKVEALRNISWGGSWRNGSWEDGQESAVRLWNQARETGEDFAYQVNRHVRRHPWKALAVALGAGVVLGAVVSLSASWSAKA